MAAALLLPGLAKAQTVAAHRVTVTGPASPVTEGGNAVFTFSLASPAAGQPNARTADLTATFSITGTATAGSDYTAPSPLSVTFPDGDNADVTVSIATTADTLNEADKTLVLTLTGVTDGDNETMFPGGTDALGSATAMLPDDDDITYSIAAPAATVTEGNPGDPPVTLTFPVTLTGAASGSVADITIPYSAVFGEATRRQISTPLPNMVTIPAGAVSDNIVLTVTHDLVHEGTSRVVMRLSDMPTVGAGAGRVRVGTAQAEGLLADNDVVTVSLLPPPDVDPDTAGIQVFEATDAVFTIMLDIPSVSTLAPTISITSQGGSSTADYMAPRFPGAGVGLAIVPAGTTSLPYPITIAYDGMDEMGEMLVVSVSGTTGSGDPPSRPFDATMHTISLVDLPASRALSVAATTATAAEGGDLVFEVTLNGAPVTEAFDVAWSLDAASTAEAADTDLGASGTVRFGVSSETAQTQTLTFGTVADALNEGTETLILSLADPCAGMAVCSVGGRPSGVNAATPTLLLLDATATATITSVPAVVIDPTLVTVQEQGASGTYTVVLTTDPAASVTVTAGRVAGSNLAVGAGSLTSQASVNLTFDSATWNTPQTVSVGAGHDANTMGAGDDTGTITHAVTGYGSVSTAAPVIVTIQDDDPDTMPSLTAVDDQTYTVDVAITPLTLPESVGDGAVNYALTPDVGTTVLPGLSFDANTRVLSGTPTAVTPTPVTLTYTATDTDGAANAAAQTFMVTVASRIDIAALDEVNEMILPEVARALAGQHAGAVTTRVRQAGQSGGGDGAGSFNFGGQSKLSSMAARHAQTLADDGVDMKRLLGDSDFVLPLGGGGGLGGTSFAMWGAGDYHNIGGESKDGGTQWDGDLFGAHLGLDARLRPNLLAGLMMSYNKADIDYKSATQEGEYELDMNSVNPYLGWSAFDGRLDIWATVGYGSGDLEITPHGGNALVHDVTTQTFGFGGGGLIRKNGEREWRLNAEAFHTRTEIDGADRNAAATQLPELKVDATRLRLMLETRHPRTTAGGARLTPSAEIGMRQDSGDGRTGAGIEVGGGVQYKDASRNLTLEVNARALLAHSGDYEDWGINGKIRIQPGADGQGASLTLTPAYGNTAATAKAIWDNGSLDTDDTKDTPLQAKLDARAGYGLNLESGLLTPYTEMTLRESSQTYRLGVQWDVTRSFDLELVGEREQADGHTVVLKGKMSF